MIERTTCAKVLQAINSYRKHSNTNFLVIFDIDDTILDTSSRRFFIYKNYLTKRFHLPEISSNLQKAYYNFIPLIKNNINYKDSDTKIKNFYLELLFSEPLLYMDTPFLGFTKFFKKISASLTVPIIFLTGRPENTMKKATYEILTRYQFLMSQNDTDRLIMKSDPKIPDTIFKKLQLKHLLNLFPEEKIIIFDNESENCKIFNEILPDDAMIVRFNSIEQKSCSFDGFLINNWIY